ncbi:MAG: hypothetical protein ACREM1_17260 [Longimicrobiales bacterium]
MTGIAPIGWMQLDAQTAAQIEWIARAQIATAVAMIIIALFLIGLIIASLILLRSVKRLVRRVERSVDQLTPHAQPLLERVSGVAGDARDVSETVRRQVNDLVHTVEGLNRSLREAGEATETRVRAFAAVLDVVQEEAEQILLDTAATARGLHTTAESLRAARPSGSLRARAAADEEVGVRG